MSQRVMVEDSYEMQGEEEDAKVGTWEARAEQLFNLCDRECKGFITKRDLQRLWGELPLGPDELEGVFDSLDQDKNGFLTLQEFTDGFGHHLGLVVEFTAECSSDKGSGGEEVVEEEGEEESKLDAIESGTITSQQLDAILDIFAQHDFDISSTVVESVWREVCQGPDDTADGAGLGRLVAALLQELSRVKADQTQLEAALNAKTDQYNQQVTNLYEELESQISGERNRAAAEHCEKGARALVSLEQEVRDREIALRTLQEDHAALMERIERLTTADLSSKQENLRLTQHLSKLEGDLSLKEKEVQELMATVNHLKKNTKDEKRRRVQQAIKVSEGISLERESLVTQLDLLRSINTQLRDEHDQSQPSTAEKSERSRSINVTLNASSLPVATKRTSIKTTTSTTPTDGESDFVISTVATKIRPPNTLDLQGSDSSERTSLDSTQTSTDFVEHDDLYFQNSKVSANNVSVIPVLTTSPTETSLLQELLQQPSLCVSCGGSVSHQSDPVSTQPRVTFKRKDSVTQTTPTIELSREEQLGEYSTGMKRKHSSPTRSLDLVMPAKIFAETNESYSKQTQTTETSVEEPGSFAERLSSPDVTKNCCCDKDGIQSQPTPNHSSTIILYNAGQRSTPDLLPSNHAINTYIHTQYKHHTYTQLPVNQVLSQATNTQSDDSHNHLSADTVNGGCKMEQSTLTNPLEQQSGVNGVDTDHKGGDMKVQNMTNGDTTLDELTDNDINNDRSIFLHQEKRRLARSLSVSVIEQAHAKNLNNIKSYINGRSHGLIKDNHQNSEKEGVTEIPASPASPTRVFKIVFIGDSGVGKTTFIHRASIGEFRGNFGSTVGVDYRLMEVCVGGVQALLQLWDTAGQERYRALTRQYYRKADGVVVMYDVNCERSFLSVADWISSVREFGDNDMVMAVIGNKNDLHNARQVHIDLAHKLSKAHDSLMYECSAATGCGVQEAMKHVAAVLTTDQQHSIDTSATVTLHQSPKSGNKCC